MWEQAFSLTFNIPTFHITEFLILGSGHLDPSSCQCRLWEQTVVTHVLGFCYAHVTPGLISQLSSINPSNSRPLCAFGESTSTREPFSFSFSLDASEINKDYSNMLSVFFLKEVVHSGLRCTLEYFLEQYSFFLS